MDAHVSLEALEKFKHILNQFSAGMSVEAQKMQLHLKKTHQQLEQKHYELRRQLQMCQDPISHERAKQQLMEFERLFAGFCQAAQECIKGFQQQELMTANREKAVVSIDRKVGVLKEYLGASSTGSGADQLVWYVNLIKDSTSYKILAQNHSAEDLIKNLESNGWSKVVDLPRSAKSGEAIKFTNPENGDVIRIMPNPANQKPYFRVQNKGGGWLDEFGKFPSNATKKELRDLTHFYFKN